MDKINRIHLKVGTKVLSIIQGEGTYSDEDTCEVAYITERGEVSEPQGYITAAELIEVIQDLYDGNSMWWEKDRWGPSSR